MHSRGGGTQCRLHDLAQQLQRNYEILKLIVRLCVAESDTRSTTPITKAGGILVDAFIHIHMVQALLNRAALQISHHQTAGFKR